MCGLYEQSEGEKYSTMKTIINSEAIQQHTSWTFRGLSTMNDKYKHI